MTILSVIPPTKQWPFDPRAVLEATAEFKAAFDQQMAAARNGTTQDCELAFQRMIQARRRWCEATGVGL